MNEKSLARRNAFSLLELLIVMSIIGILAAIGLPAYTHHVVNSNRAQAQLALLHLASRLESYHHLHGTYEGASLKKLRLVNHTQNNAYHIKIASTKEQHYEIKAIPQGKQTRDKMCQTLGLDEANKKTISANGSVNKCWH